MTPNTTGPATAQDFSRWEDHAQTLDLGSIGYIIQDCLDAARAMSGWNPEREGYYVDQAGTYRREITRRIRSVSA